jgi:hypothetical protein
MDDIRDQNLLRSRRCFLPRFFVRIVHVLARIGTEAQVAEPNVGKGSASVVEFPHRADDSI